MKTNGLAKFIREIEKAGELNRIKETVSPNLEITEVADRISKLPGGGKALLFENTGTEFPLLINGLGSAERIKLAFHGHTPDDLTKMMHQLLEDFTSPTDGLSSKLALLPKLSKFSSWMPKKLKGRGACQEIVQEQVDLLKLPVLNCWPHDGGPFITLPLVHTKDPLSGAKNLGMYRMQVFSKDETGMHWQVHKTGARHYRSYRELKKKMPVAVSLGGDPAYTYCATAPLPDGIDEYILAGFLRQRSVNLVKCLTQDLWVPEDSDIVIEGYVDPAEPLRTEGPFGDHTGFYSLEDQYPVFHVTAITHKKGAVYPATIVGIPPQEDVWMAWATEKLFLPPIQKTMIPELKDMHMPVPGVAHNLALLKMNSDYPGHARKVIHSVWGAGQMMFTKYPVVLRDGVELNNYHQVVKEISDRVDPARHIEFGYGPLDVLDHAARKPFEGGKMGVDATGPLLPEEFRQYKLTDKTPLLTLQSSTPEIEKINLDWLQKGYSVGLIALSKNRSGLCQELAGEIRLTEGLNNVRFWIFFDRMADLNDPAMLVWLIGGCTDPDYDTWIFPGAAPEKPGMLFIDATTKTMEHDAFERPWPNPVVMDQLTIDKVDQMWPRLGLGASIVSPSVKYRKLSQGDGARLISDK